jgi:hypothetical protein
MNTVRMKCTKGVFTTKGLYNAEGVIKEETMPEWTLWNIDKRMNYDGKIWDCSILAGTAAVQAECKNRNKNA